MTTETVTVTAGGRTWTNWEAITITYGATQAVRAARLTTVDAGVIFGAAWVFFPGADVTIAAGGELVLTGFVETFSPKVDDRQHVAEVTIVSKAKDAVEASAIHPNGEIRGKKLGAIAREIDPTGTTWAGEADQPVPVFRLKPGETVFDAIERGARGSGTLLIGRADGGVDLVTGPQGRHAGVIADGGFLAGQATLSIAGRHDEIKVRGQSAEDFTARGQQPEAVAKVPLPRRRPRVLLHGGDARSERIRTQAEWEARREAGASVRATIELARWRDDGGRLWRPAWLVPVESEFLRIGQAMVVMGVSLVQDGRSGTRATLTLADPGAVGGKATKGGGSDGVWSLPEPDVSETQVPP